MMNIMKADLYAILRGKALYVTFASLFAFIGFFIGTTVHFINTMPPDTIEGTFFAFVASNFNGVGSAAVMLSAFNVLAFFLLPLILVSAAPIFNHDTVKNDLAWGFGRTKLYFSKLIVALCLCAALVVIFMATGMVVATIMNGVGGPAPAGYWQSIAASLGIQLILMIALTCIGVFLMFGTRRTAAVNAVYLAFLIAPQMILPLLVSLLGDGFSWLRALSILQSMNDVNGFFPLEPSQATLIVAAGLFYLAASTIGGIILFNRAEIK